MAQTPNRARRGRASLSSNHAAQDPRLASTFRAGTRLEDFDKKQFQQDKNGRICIHPDALVPKVGQGLQVVSGEIRATEPSKVLSVKDKTTGTVSSDGTIPAVTDTASAANAIATLAAQVERLRKSQQGK